MIERLFVLTVRTLVRSELLGAANRAGSGPLHLCVGGSDSLVHEWSLPGLSHPLRKLVVMVAVLHPAHVHSAPAPLERPVSPRPRHLRLVRAETTSATDPLAIVAVVAIMATLLLVVLVRGVQGAPPASDWQTLTESSAPSAAASLVSETVTVVDGDSWASIAARVEPGIDPVEFARSLASVNGGYELHVGQVLVLPAAG